VSVPDDRWGASEPRLVELLRDEISAAPGQRITFARFMQRALTEPGLGYYATSDERATRAGDFLTAPEIHPIFARCMARFLAGTWERMGEPGRWAVEEHGAGGGTLRDRTLEALREDRSRLASVIDWRAIDLPGRGDARADAPIEGVVLANELLDALPVHRMRQAEDELRELFVAWVEGWFAFVEGPPSTPLLAARLDEAGARLVAGQVADVCLGTGDWTAAVARRLVRGVVLVIDYGHPAGELYGPRHRQGTLLAYRRHQVTDEVLDAVGRQDLTAHVDLTALARAAESSGLDPLGATTQARFLVGLGLGDLLAAMGRAAGADAAAYVDARASVLRLLDPRHLGGHAVMAWGRGVPTSPSLPGFATDR
jgi:SAM-dependent MidA family methyltransferase